MAPFVPGPRHRPRSPARCRPAREEPPTNDSESFATIKEKVSTSALPLRDFRTSVVLSGSAEESRYHERVALANRGPSFDQVPAKSDGNSRMDARLRERYSRQILFGPIGEEGQERLRHSSATIIGCGALGSTLASLMVRAGIGRLRIVDRDFVEPSNLQRQTLFEESDALEALPKAVAAERRLRGINSGVAVEGIVADLGPKNAEELLHGFPLILDGTDNFETRFLLNDAAIHLDVPWIYAAVVASYGVTLTVRPGQTACLACALESGGPSGTDDDSQATAAGAEDTC